MRPCTPFHHTHTRHRERGNVSTYRYRELPTLRTVTPSHSARTSSHRVGWASHRPRGIPGSTPIRWERARQLRSAQARLRRPRHRRRRRRGARRRRRRERTVPRRAAPRGETRGGIRGAALPCRIVLTYIRTLCERAPPYEPAACALCTSTRGAGHLAFGLHTHTVGTAPFGRAVRTLRTPLHTTKVRRRRRDSTGNDTLFSIDTHIQHVPFLPQESNAPPAPPSHPPPPLTPLTPLVPCVEARGGEGKTAL